MLLQRHCTRKAGTKRSSKIADDVVIGGLVHTQVVTRLSDGLVFGGVFNPRDVTHLADGVGLSSLVHPRVLVDQGLQGRLYCLRDLRHLVIRTQSQTSSSASSPVTPLSTTLTKTSLSKASTVTPL